MEAEYANRYKHLPADTMSWHRFLSLVVRASRFETRDRLVVADGTLMGQPATSEQGAGQRMLMDAKLRDLAQLGEKV
jgi:hypothetical protein